MRVLALLPYALGSRMSFSQSAFAIGRGLILMVSPPNGLLALPAGTIRSIELVVVSMKKSVGV